MEEVMSNTELQRAIDTAISYLKEHDSDAVEKSLEKMLAAQAERAISVKLK